MRVMKFGGAVMRNPEGFAAMTAILRHYRNEPLLVVVSAFSTVTRDLKHAASLAEQGDEHEALALADTILAQHERFSQELLRDEQTREALLLLLQEHGKRLREYLRGVAITRELTPRTLDAILSYGEYLAVHLTKHYLQEQQFTVAFVDAADIIVTDDRHGAAVPNREQTAGNTEEKLLPQLHRTPMVITQGFIGRSSAGEITTMGMESSNLTATLLGELIGAQEIFIWTDVEGIRSADPRYASTTFPIPHLSYAQAHTAALNGVKLLHPDMIAPVRRASIPLHIRSAFAPEGEGTMITRATPAAVPPILSLRREVTILNVEHTGIGTEVGASDFPGSLLRNPSDILFYTVRKDSVCVVARCPVSHFYLHLLPDDAEPHIRADYALISVIGETASEVLSALASCSDFLESARLPLVEIGAQPHIARLVVQLHQAQPLFDRLHSFLLEHSVADTPVHGL